MAFDLNPQAAFFKASSQAPKDRLFQDIGLKCSLSLVASKDMSAKKNSKKAATSTASWGGARPGAGRKANAFLAPHLSRELKRHCPMMITLVLRSELPSLQEASLVQAFHKGSQRARRHGLRVIEYALFEKRIFLLCEFKNRKDLESSLKSLTTTLAIAVKRAVQEKTDTLHRGPVFLGRYRMETLDSPEKVIQAQLKMLPHAEKDFAYSSLLCMSPLKATETFARYPLLQSASDHSAPNENAEDRARGEAVLKFIHAAEEDPRLMEARREAIATTASPQFSLTQSGWLRATASLGSELSL